MFLLIDKPKGITSHNVIDKIRRITGEARVGHAGTLDPNATGLLIVGIGRESTKKLGQIAKNTKKTYEAEIFLGEERDTDDSEGVVASKVKGFLPPREGEIKLILASFLGRQKQRPPIYSAIKIKGKKSYKLARAGRPSGLKPRKVTICLINLIEYKYPILKIKTTVSSGTYIRALARDIGQKTGCGAYLKELRRKEVGEYSVDRAMKLQGLTKKNWKKFIIDIR